MAVEVFSFGNAVTHFTRVPNPVGFFWKFALAYILVYGAVFAIVAMIIGPAYLRLFQLTAENPDTADPGEVMALMAPIFGGYALATPLILLAWSILEASIQRKYMRHGGFSVGLGADELRIFVVGLLFGLVLLGLYLLAGAIVSVPIVMIALASSSGGDASGAALAMVIAIPLFFIMACFILFVMVRLSPATALTIRDRKIRFTSAWAVSKGHFWQIFGALLVIGIASGIASQTVQSVLMFGMMGTFFANAEAIESGDFSGLLTSPALWLSLSMIMFFSILISAASHFVGAGVPALAARTDPAWMGEGSRIDGTFS